jgi:hypothetical protein
VSPVRSFVGDRGRQNAQNAENRRRSRAKMRTGDAKWSDLGRKMVGPGTERARTCDGRTAGRRQARRQDEGRHGTRQEQAKNAGNGWDVGKNDYICGISTDINLLTL